MGLELSTSPSVPPVCLLCAAIKIDGKSGPFTPKVYFSVFLFAWFPFLSTFKASSFLFLVFCLLLWIKFSLGHAFLALKCNHHFSLPFSYVCLVFSICLPLSCLQLRELTISLSSGTSQKLAHAQNKLVKVIFTIFTRESLASSSSKWQTSIFNRSVMMRANIVKKTKFLQNST